MRTYIVNNLLDSLSALPQPIETGIDLCENILGSVWVIDEVLIVSSDTPEDVLEALLAFREINSALEASVDCGRCAGAAGLERVWW